MADFDLSNFESIEPQQFAQLVKGAKDAQIAEAMNGDLRYKVLGEIFSRMPGTFRPEKAGSLNAVIHWSITGASDGGYDTYEVVIANGTCSISDGAPNEPKVALTVAPVEFLKIVSGNGNPVMMFMTGKLKAKGDLGLAANIANLFDIPKA